MAKEVYIVLRQDAEYLGDSRFIVFEDERAMMESLEEGGLRDEDEIYKAKLYGEVRQVSMIIVEEPEVKK